MKTCYGIRDWNDHFENSQSRKCSRTSWIPVPNKHDGKGYRRLIQKPNGAALYAAWVLMLQVASKCPTRGVLADDDGPLDADDLSAKTGCPAELFAEAFEFLSTDRVKWLVTESAPATDGRQGACSQTTTSELPDHPAASSQNRTEGNGTEGKNTHSPEVCVSVETVVGDLSPATQQELAECVEDGPDSSEYPASFLDIWNTLPTGKRGVVHVGGLPPQLSPKDQTLFDRVWPHRQKDAIAAMAKLQAGGIGWDRSPVTVKEFFGSSLIDELLADKHVARKSSESTPTEKPQTRLNKAQREHLERKQRAAN